MSAAEMDRYKDGGGSGYQGNGTPDDGGGQSATFLSVSACLSPTQPLHGRRNLAGPPQPTPPAPRELASLRGR